MDFMHLFFSFEGRTRRSHYWIGIVILWVVEMVVWSFTLGGAMSAATMAGNPGAAFASGSGLIGAVILLAVLWPSLALQVKRWHDRNKTGWMVLINFIPLAGVIWTFIECGFIDGTPGPNTYGPSPKGLAGSTVATV